MRVIHQSENCTPELAERLQKLVNEAVSDLNVSPTMRVQGMIAPRVYVEFDKGLWTINQQDGGFNLEEPVAQYVKAQLQIKPTT